MRLGIVLRKYRTVSELTLRELAPEIGLSLATLQRVESGKPCDAEALMKIFVWLTGKAD